MKVCCKHQYLNALRDPDLTPPKFFAKFLFMFFKNFTRPNIHMSTAGHFNQALSPQFSGVRRKQFEQTLPKEPCNKKIYRPYRRRKKKCHLKSWSKLITKGRLCIISLSSSSSTSVNYPYLVNTSSRIIMLLVEGATARNEIYKPPHGRVSVDIYIDRHFLPSATNMCVKSFFLFILTIVINASDL